MRWRWDGGASPEFADRDDAEDWMSEHWRGIEAAYVELVDDDGAVVYEMELTPPSG